MDSSSAPDRFTIFEIYKRYSDIKANNLLHRNDDMNVVNLSREALTELYRLIDKSMVSRDSVFDEVATLMSRLNLKEDFSEFSNFYEFVYYLCRENGQKNISVNRAIAAWKLVLSGRFRLLNQWCDFIEENDSYVLDIKFRKSIDAWREVTEIQSFITIIRSEPRQKNQRHNISLDTWSQVLAFSRCVHEDLEGYDPEGAWPVLIDDFVEHMYRITGSSCYVSRDMACNCADSETQQFASDDTLPGLKGFPGLKRKLRDDNQRKDLDKSEALSLESLSLELDSKRRKQDYESVACKENQLVNPSIETRQLNNPVLCSMSLCSVEQCLSKGFEGLLSSHSSVQFNPEDEVFYS